MEHSGRPVDKNKGWVNSHPLFLFTLDAIRTHDLPLRRRLLYPAELPGPVNLSTHLYYHKQKLYQVQISFIYNKKEGVSSFFLNH